MRPIRVFILSCSIALLAPPIARADPTPGASASPAAAASPSASNVQSQKLPPVVVTATRIEQPVTEIGTTVTVIDKSQIESQQIQSVDNVLRQVPGVTVTQGGSPGTVAEILIRGASPSQTSTMIDGVEVNTGATGGFDISNLTT